mgnify:CR=1 FL=1
MLPTKSVCSTCSPPVDDGVAPMNQILRTLADIGFRGMLSLEVFNREYWKNPPIEVAQTGLAKMRGSKASSCRAPRYCE